MWSLQISVGYFISDLAMILWFYPMLGGTEYVWKKHNRAVLKEVSKPMS
jgi:hypothetical protein